MRMRLGVFAVPALWTGAAAIAATSVPLAPSAPMVRVADTTAPDGETSKQAGTPPANSGPLQVQPGPETKPPAQPPNLTVPPSPVTPPQPGQTGPKSNPPPTFEQHQEPGPGGENPNGPPRGEGAAMIPKQTPSGIKAIEDWISSWFQ
jgi:hypothetical protein